MGKRDVKQVQGDIQARQGTADTQFNNLNNQDQQTTNEAITQTGETRPQAVAGYSNIANTGGMGLAPDKIAPVGSAMGGYSALASNGGYDDSRRASIMEDVGGLKDLGKTGGISPESMQRMQGLGVYDQFANNGGFSDADKANIKAQALSPISSMASTTRDELARRRNVQGGYAPGFDASSRALRRDTARNIADTSLNANVGIQNQVNANKLAGAQGASSSEVNAQGLRTGNMYKGLMGAGDMEMGLQNNINSGMLSGLGGMNTIDMENAGIQGQNIGNQMQYQGNSLQGQLAGLGGLNSIYGSDVGQVENARNRAQTIPAQQNQIQQGYINPSAQLAMNKSGVGSNIMSGLGTAASVASGLFGGGGGTSIGGTPPNGTPQSPQNSGFGSPDVNQYAPTTFNGYPDWNTLYPGLGIPPPNGTPQPYYGY